MSFSGSTKEELIRHYSKAVHCQNAELAGMLLASGAFREIAGKTHMVLHTDSLDLAKKCFTTLRKNFKINAEFSVRFNELFRKRRNYHLFISDQDVIRQLQDVEALTARPCCKRAFLRGAFLTGGTISDPEKSYQMEILTEREEDAAVLKGLMNDFDVAARVTRRRGKYELYIKESESISEMLRIMEATASLMKFENIRILHEMRGSVNRQVNCETANITKTVSAAARQIQDIRLIEETIGFEELEESLKEIAMTRLANPETPLAELGEQMVPPLGKSGVNHRMRKIAQIAAEIRKREKL